MHGERETERDRKREFILGHHPVKFGVHTPFEIGDVFYLSHDDNIEVSRDFVGELTSS